MRRLAAMLVVGLLVAGSTALGGDAGKQDKEKLNGKWLVVTGKFLGKEVPLPEGGVSMHFDGDKVKFKEGTKPEEEGSYKIDASKSPKHIDVTPPKGPMMAGIYKFDGDNLTICVGLPDFKDKDAPAPRPKSFDDEKTFTFVMKRTK